MRDDLTWDNYYGAPDPGAIDAFEQLIGFTFPESYRSIVEQHNGATVEPDAFKVFHNHFQREAVLGAGMFLPFGEAAFDGESMSISWRTRPEEMPREIITFATMGDGDDIAFDYRDLQPGQQPAIVLWHFHADSFDTAITRVAESFERFLDMLFDEDDNEE